MDNFTEHLSGWPMQRKLFLLVLLTISVVYGCRKEESSASHATPDVRLPSEPDPISLKNNILKALGEDLPKQWDETVLDVQKALGQTIDKFDGTHCPEIVALKERSVHDEFERKEREESIEKLRKICFSKSSAQKLPSLLFTEVKINGREEYDFERECYWLTLDEKIQTSSDGAWAIEYHRGCMGNFCMLSQLLISETSQDVVFKHSYSSKYKEQYITHVQFPIAKTNAKAFMSRLDENNAHRRLQILFEPKPARDAIPLGLAIAYRVIDDHGVLFPWKLFMPDPRHPPG